MLKSLSPDTVLAARRSSAAFTSAFTLGVAPLAIATRASAASQNATGTGVFGGKTSATVLALLFVLVFFVFVMRIFDRGKPKGADCLSGKRQADDGI